VALIALDADGVLVDFAGGLCRILRERGHVHEWPERMHHWDLSKCFTPCTSAAARAIMCERDFCYSLPWLPEAVQMVNDLRSDGHDLICVTSPNEDSPYWMHERRERLRELFDSGDILFAKGPRKALVAADIIVEDHPGNAAGWCERNPGLALLLDRPWNSVRASEWVCHPRMIRLLDDAHVRSWARLGTGA
jgi:5'(3')-deoxyribonucleotidase